MSWPGQKELEEEDDDESPDDDTANESSKAVGSPAMYNMTSSSLANHPSVMPPKAQKEEMQHKMTIRQLGYIFICSHLHPPFIISAFTCSLQS